MGVKQLNTFLSKNADTLLKPTRLHSCTLVIDGNNLAYAIYAGVRGSLEIPYQYAGDYDTYAKAVRQCFNALRQCQIKALVLMDGMSEESKEQTAIQRAQQKIDGLSEGKLNEIPPLFILSVFRQVLRELHILHIVCDYEADAHTVSVANQMGATVLSSDSDFLIFECQHGVIRIEDLNWRIMQDGGSRYLQAQVYNITVLGKRYRLKTARHARLLAILMGNDYIDREETAGFVTFLNGGRDASTLRITDRVELILWWVSSITSFKCALREIASSCAEDSDRMYDELESVSKTYHVPNDVTAERIDGVLTLQSEGVLYSPDVVELPDRIHKLFQLGHISSYVIDVFCKRKYILRCQVEDIGQPSSHKCALRLRQVLCSMILSDSSMDVTVLERDRCARNLEDKTREKMNTLPSGKDIPRLTDNPAPSHEGILDALEYYTDFQTETPWERFITTMVGVLRFWKRHSSASVEIHHQAAVVVCLIKLLLVDKDGRDVCQYGESFPAVDEEHLSAVRHRMSDVCTGPKGVYDYLTMHRLAELQAVMFAVYGLNGVLQLPVILPQMNYIYSGSFIYRLITRLQTNCATQQHVHEHVRELLSVQKLVDVYESIITRL